jgi:hypothetical protein
MNLKNRIEAIEARSGAGEDDDTPKAIFFICSYASLNAPPLGPVIGWFNQDRRYLKMPGESDQDLADRAAAAEKALLHHRLAVPSLFSIHEGE